MILFKNTIELSSFLATKKGQNCKIGFVPTMGALHDGHLSLVKKALDECDLVVCSIFVNPTQFNQSSDLENYPRSIGSDIQKLTEAGCSVLFHPDVKTIYGELAYKDSAASLGNFIHYFEGAKRPGHFDGVVTILKIFFDLIQPRAVFFGQKDYQQCLVVKSLIQKDYQEIEFNICETTREMDGLAMSSRNIRLNESERAIAPKVFQNLQFLLNNWNRENWKKTLLEATENLNIHPFDLEYLSVCNPNNLEPLIDFSENAIALVAVKLGNTRLIDNIFLSKNGIPINFNPLKNE